MSKIAIVNKETLNIDSIYWSEVPNQKLYGGPWGNPELYAHVTIPEGVDTDCAVAALVEADPQQQIEEHIAVEEDPIKKAAKDAAGPKLAVQKTIRAARTFGNQMVEDFSVDNVLLGITQDGMTGEVLNKMSQVIVALQSGSLYEAMDRIKAIPEEDKDVKYITDDRLLDALNKIEMYLGLNVSLSL